jgi:hypothetical protein
VTDHALTLYDDRPFRRPSEEDRRLFLRRLIAWGLVALIHVFLLSILVVDQHHWRELAFRRPVETILDLTRLPKGAAPPIEMIQPIVPRAAPPVVTTAPVIVVPPPPNSQIAPPQTPADILKAIGEALSCGAENFENLTEAERTRCKHEPWVARKLPNGTIVLEAQAPQAIQPPAGLSGADAMRHEMQTAPGCPILANVPCMNPTPLIRIPVN